MKIRKMLLFPMILLLLTGCSEETPAPDPSSGQLTIEFQTQPSPPILNQPIQLKATVAENGTPIEDAQVEIEVWKKGEEDRDKLSAPFSQDAYTASKTFTDIGTYQVIVHVTTDKTHQMINPSFTIGQGDENEDHHAHDHDSDVVLHMMLPDAITSGNETELISHVTHHGKPMEQAEVQYEVWKEGEQKHHYFDAEEVKPGEYSASHIFPTEGTYHIQLHVEKGDHIHAHQKEKITVSK